MENQLITQEKEAAAPAAAAPAPASGAKARRHRFRPRCLCGRWGHRPEDCWYKPIWRGTTISGGVVMNGGSLETLVRSLGESQGKKTRKRHGKRKGGKTKETVVTAASTEATASVEAAEVPEGANDQMVE